MGNHLVFGIFGVALCLALPNFLLKYWTSDTVKTPEVVLTLESLRNIFSMVLGPLAVYVFSPKLRKYVYLSLQSLFL